MTQDDRQLTLIVVADGEMATRSYTLSYRRVRLLAALGIGAAVVIVGLLLSWAFLASRAAAVPGLRREVATLREERAKVGELERALHRMEARYGQVQTLLGADSVARPMPIDPAAGGDEPPDSTGGPMRWPLGARGHVTRVLVRTPGRHPGIDIAVRSGTPVMAGAAGTVAETGDDPVYGQFVRLTHPGGVESMYGHLSRVAVTEGQTVPRGGVLGRSGNTGRSTAPHLHFEIRRDGEAVDPRDFVTQPKAGKNVR